MEVKVEAGQPGSCRMKGPQGAVSSAAEASLLGRPAGRAGPLLDSAPGPGAGEPVEESCRAEAAAHTLGCAPPASCPSSPVAFQTHSLDTAALRARLPQAVQEGLFWVVGQHRQVPRDAHHAHSHQHPPR